MPGWRAEAAASRTRSALPRSRTRWRRSTTSPVRWMPSDARWSSSTTPRVGATTNDSSMRIGQWPGTPPSRGRRSTAGTEGRVPRRRPRRDPSPHASRRCPHLAGAHPLDSRGEDLDAVARGVGDPTGAGRGGRGCCWRTPPPGDRLGRSPGQERTVTWRRGATAVSGHAARVECVETVRESPAAGACPSCASPRRPRPSRRAVARDGGVPDASAPWHRPARVPTSTAS